MTKSFVTAQGICKQFAGVQALQDVSIGLRPGEIRCLMGENGCGKSTLIKILAGIYRPDSGTIRINQRTLPYLRPREAIDRGIQVIYQDLALFPNLTVAENIALPIQLEQGRFWVNKRRMRHIARQALQRIAAEIDLSQSVQDLPVAHRQLVSIARALVHDAQLVIMDEPTTALTHREIDRLFGVIQGLQQQHVSVLFVSHKLNEVFEISEQVTILRNGRNVAQGPTSAFSRRQLTALMTGREVTPIRPARKTELSAPQTPALQVDGLTRPGAFQDISFSIQAGEIVGMTGLLGSGRRELGLSLFGLLPGYGGTIQVAGKTVVLRSVSDAMRHGLAYVPEDRLTAGLFMERSVRKNILATTARQLRSPLRLLDRDRIDALGQQCIRQWDIKAAGLHAPVQTLSGGNQQKVVLAKWLSTDARILILNGPTVGVDIGAKVDIHSHMRQLAAQGLALLVMSDDLPELAQTCHRILLMHRGRLLADLQGDACTEDHIQGTLNQLM